MFDVESDELRDVFAIAALIGLVSRGEHTNPWEMARGAYSIAQAMIDVREEQNEG